MRWAEQGGLAKACFQFGRQVLGTSGLAVKVVDSRHLPLGLSLAVYKMGGKCLSCPSLPRKVAPSHWELGPGEPRS